MNKLKLWYHILKLQRRLLIIEEAITRLTFVLEVLDNRVMVLQEKKPYVINTKSREVWAQPEKKEEEEEEHEDSGDISILNEVVTESERAEQAPNGVHGAP